MSIFVDVLILMHVMDIIIKYWARTFLHVCVWNKHVYIAILYISKNKRETDLHSESCQKGGVTEAQLFTGWIVTCISVLMAAAFSLTIPELVAAVSAHVQELFMTTWCTYIPYACYQFTYCDTINMMFSYGDDWSLHVLCARNTDE